MKLISKTLFILLLTSYSFFAYPIWFEGPGEAIINDGQIATARQQAVKDALLSLMYHGGASVSSLQTIKSGVLEVDKLTVRTNGEVVDMHLLTEKIVNDKLKVTISADIYPFDSCKKDNYAKSLFVGPITLDTPEQAQLGGLYQLPETVTKRLYKHFKTKNKQINARQVRTRAIAFNNSSSEDIESQMLSVAQDISSQYDVQYILFGNINDMSSYDENSTNFLGVSENVKNRNYHMQIYVIDGVNKEMVFQKSYGAHSAWPFDITMRLNPNESTFWSTDYGKLINYFINESANEVENAFACEPTLASIVSIYNNDNLVINIGKVNGVRKGDKFKLIRKQYVNFQNIDAQEAIFDAEDIVFKVMSVQSTRAILKTADASNMANIQIRDILTPVTEDDF